MVFEDRADAARRLLQSLSQHATDNAVVMAIPRGAVPMGSIIAEHFHWPLGIVLIKKIAHPGNPEYAIGAVGLEHVLWAPGHDDVSPKERAVAMAQARAILRDRADSLLRNYTQPDVMGRTIILVDDGMATGATMLAAIDVLRMQNPLRIVVAVPVASTSAVEAIRDHADEMIVLHSTDDFSAVGAFYEEFSQVTDEEVREILSRVGM